MRWILALLALLNGACASAVETYRTRDLVVHTVRADYANSHLLVKSGQAILIDSGVPDEAEHLDESIRELGVDPAELRAVVLTHGHYDHAGGAHHFKTKYNIPIVAGRADEAMLASGKMDRLCPVGLIAQLRVDTDQNATFPQTAADIWVDDHLALAPIAGFAGEIVAVPGHTPGSLVVVVDHIAVVGDLFRGELACPNPSQHFYMCDLDDNRRDIELLLTTIAPNARQFFTGHFGPLPRRAVKILAN